MIICTAGCAHRVSVSEDEWVEEKNEYGSLWNDENDEKMYHGNYRFHLVDGKKISPTKFTKTDSTFVILQIYDGLQNADIEPMVLPVTEVASIDKITMWWFPTTLILTGLLIAIGFAALLGAGFETLD